MNLEITPNNVNDQNSSRTTEYKLSRGVTRVGTFEVCVLTHVALRMFIVQVLASQLHFLANRNAELATPPLFWAVNCIKIGGHVALLSDPTVYSLHCVTDCQTLFDTTCNVTCRILDNPRWRTAQ